MKHEIDIDAYANWKLLEAKSGKGQGYVLSDRGIELIYDHSLFMNPEPIIQVACEDHCKWYQLYVLRGDHQHGPEFIGDLQYHEIEAAVDAVRGSLEVTRDGLCAQGDHCVNPGYLEDFCRRAGVHLSNRVRYMVQGMWWENHL